MFDFFFLDYFEQIYGMVKAWVFMGFLNESLYEYRIKPFRVNSN